MDSPVMSPGSALSSNDDTPRVKFLCSFLGSILPRPHDGKLRYVGGETRIVSVPRDITYEELMAKMRELFEGATVLKYQQPDEDLDALVSVVNDDDVTNMMEEYDKLDAGDGFTRLRIFLFSQIDQDGPMHFVDGDERDKERRYVDALNSLNESPEYRLNQPGDNLSLGPLEEAQIGMAEQFFNQMNLEAGLHNQRNAEIPMPPIHLQQLKIPPLLSTQTQQSVTQKYNEMEAPWSPGYYSPRQPARQMGEYPTSPSSSRYRAQHGEFSDKSFDRVAEEYNRNLMNHQSPYESQQQFAENVSTFPSGTVLGDKAGFPGNIMHGTNMLDSNNVCEHCRVAFQRYQTYSESLWKHGEQQHVEPASMGNGFHHVGIPCADCPPNREIFVLNADPNMQHSYYLGDHNEHRPLYTESQSHERARPLQHQLTPRAEESRAHAPGAGRLTDHYVLDNNMSHGHVNVSDSHYVPSHFVHHDDPRLIRHSPELSNQMLHDPTIATGSHIHIQPIEERGVRYGNPSYAFGADNIYQVTPAPVPVPAHGLWRNSHVPVHGVTSYETSASPQLPSVNPGFIRVESSPRMPVGLENQNLWIDSLQKTIVPDGASVPEYSNGPPRKLPNVYNQENQLFYKPSLICPPGDMMNISTPLRSDLAVQVGDKVVLSSTLDKGNDTASVTELARVENSGHRAVHVGDNVILCTTPETTNDIVRETELASIDNSSHGGDMPAVQGKVEDLNVVANKDSAVVDDNSSIPLEKEELSEMIAYFKTEVMENVEEVKSRVEDNTANVLVHDTAAKDEHQNETDAVDAQGDGEMDSDNENSKNSKIELTKAEEEALNRGLQTIKNEDLEEIRELGSGTYGSVYHGKWKGSDVAIKRIKASCFAGRPSERERLISDFWKEALILSSLHHPNVVSFYGVVRDGPDGSLATVTEFMINGSLKQFLQKKDRTIDRRKRLIIAMDAAFGMEYLHGKNIVHFDLKCENLLVNMRDPHRPVCKIGDLGLSKVKQHTLVSGGVRGTLPWMAPELLSGKSNMVTEKIDVYSFGVVMWELLTGDEPYKDIHCASIIGGIVNNTLRPQIPSWCDPEWKSLMESCWGSDPAERPSFSDISQKLRSMAAAMNLK